MTMFVVIKDLFAFICYNDLPDFLISVIVMLKMINDTKNINFYKVFKNEIELSRRDTVSPML